MWRPFLTLAFLAGLSLAATAGAQTPPAGTTISGGDLPHSVRLAATDEDDFFRRLQPPPRLDDPPDNVNGAGYLVRSSYWEKALHSDREDRPPAEAEAFYFQDGFVLARQGGEEVWLVLDLRQRAILDRYIRLTEAGLLGEAPGTMQVLAAAAKTEEISVAVGSRELSAAEIKQFWELTQGVQLRRDLVRGTPAPPWPPTGESIVWLTFTMAEGQSVQLIYSVGSGVLVDRSGTELYPVPSRWLEPLLGDAIALSPGRPLTIGGVEIEQQPGRGSPLWWLVMVGGGVSCLVAAVWLRRRLTPAG